VDLNAVADYAPAPAATWRDGDAWLGGGTWLFSQPQPRLRRLLDLQAFGWPPLTETDDGLAIAATCTLAQLARWRPARPSRAPAAELARQCCDALLGSFKVWNAATVGGNLCLALPAGPMISLCTALDGVCTIWEPGGEVRALPADEFVRAPGETALRPGALLRSVLLPAPALRSRTAFRRQSLSPLGRSAALVIGRQGIDAGEVVITITAAVTRPLQLRFATVPGADELRAAIDERAPEYHDDVHGDPRWRRHLTTLLAEQVREQLAGAG
jgi:CO/xanthine dehydrogenase FAD-binding subunit